MANAFMTHLGPPVTIAVGQENDPQFGICYEILIGLSVPGVRECNIAWHLLTANMQLTYTPR